MRVVVTTEHRFERTPDGAVWTQTMFPLAFWSRYTEVFDEARVVARVLDVAEPPEGATRADGPGVSFAAIPYYVGPAQYLARRGRVRAAARAAVGRADAVILRVVSPIGSLIEGVLRRTGRPYGVEVVGDPYDVFVPGAVRHPLRRFFRWWFPRQLRRQCSAACAAAYVTESALQRRYPPAPGAFTTNYSSVELPGEAFAAGPRAAQAGPEPLRLVAVGSMTNYYKGFDVLIDAVARCTADGLDLRLVVLGDGRYRTELEARANELGVGGRIRFPGQVPAGQAVRAEFDRAELFVMPSRTEGLPRAMIEAMARGLPCIGSRVGGIPELLEPEDMTPPGDAEALARKIAELAADPARRGAASARNLERARGYRLDVLRERRLAFYREVLEATRAWSEGERDVVRAARSARPVAVGHRPSAAD